MTFPEWRSPGDHIPWIPDVHTYNEMGKIKHEYFEKF
jgi:hypothetical protein